VVVFAELLVYLIAGKQELISYLCKKSAKALLPLCHKPQVIQADIERIALKGFRICQLIERIAVYMAVDLIVVHQLCHADITKGILILSSPEVVGKDLHEHRLTSARLSDQHKILADLIVLIGKDTLCQRASIEIVE